MQNSVRLAHNPAMPHRTRHVALIYDARLAYDLKVMAGVAAYLREGSTWSVYIEENALKDQRLPDLRSWEGDGVIADFDDPNVAKAVAQSGLPAVGFGSGYGWYAPESPIPYFFTNNEAIAKLAADHLLERGLRHLAYCGYPPSPINGWSEERERGFIKRVQERGLSCAVYHGPSVSGRKWPMVQRSLCAWLSSLPKPLGLMAANDNRGRQVLEACRNCSVRVPEDVAVIAVDNDDLLCQFASPPLSSIEQGAKRIGYEAAALLDRLMRGDKPKMRRFVVDPVQIVPRQSTDMLAVDDRKVAEAMAFISDHACEGIKVQQVVKAVAISRSGLEARFRTVLGRTIRCALRDAQLQRARKLIVGTDLPLKQIAAKTGFRSVQHMTSLFGKAFGHSPARYRKMAAF